MPLRSVEELRGGDGWSWVELGRAYRQVTIDMDRVDGRWGGRNDATVAEYREKRQDR